jgi:23S rRNA pseudouridine955/2504/2580 synthase
VHLQSRGHAILGDPKYTDPRAEAAAKSLGLNRLFLHAWRLELSEDAWGEALSLSAALPPALALTLERAALQEPKLEH